MTKPQIENLKKEIFDLNKQFDKLILDFGAELSIADFKKLVEWKHESMHKLLDKLRFTIDMENLQRTDPNHEK
jgi:hypothetical protein